MDAIHKTKEHLARKALPGRNSWTLGLVKALKFVLLLFGTLLTGLLNYFLLGPIAAQALTSGWSMTSGTIKAIDYVLSHTSKGSTFRVEVSYDYQVDGKHYLGERVSLSQFGVSGVDWSREYCESHPEGSTVKVFYNPDKPEEAVLEQGLQSSDLALMLAAGPFNAMVFGGWMVLFGYTSSDIPSRRSLFAKLRAAFVGFCSGIGCLTFPSVFLVGFFYKMHPPMVAIQALWAGILALAAWIAWGSFRDNRTSIEPSRPR